jgi:hypothetical protein
VSLRLSAQRLLPTLVARYVEKGLPPLFTFAPANMSSVFREFLVLAGLHLASIDAGVVATTFRMSEDPSTMVTLHSRWRTTVCVR